MISRTLDPAFLNSVANDPAVRPSLGGDGKLDLSGLVADPANYALQADNGGFLLTPRGAGHYEVHSIFQPGSNAIKAMRNAAEWMFTRSDCISIWSKVPAVNDAAKGLARVGGLKTVFEREHERLGKTAFGELSILNWAMMNPKLEAHGERFHNLLETEKENHGSSLSAHPHDPAHERAVGAALLMMERGQAMKGANFYNLWAGVADYQQITLISLSPVTVDAGDAVLGMGESGMEILLCR